MRKVILQEFVTLDGLAAGPNDSTDFVLDVFDCDYDEIGVVISKRADTCRQLLRRARQHLTDARARFEVSPEQLQKLARQFALTCASGDLKGLVTALA